MVATIPDLLRLLVLPVLGWVAWRDLETRRVPNRVWLPLFGLGALLVLWESVAALTGSAPASFYFLRLGLSLGLVIPLTYAFWWTGSFGGADAKAFFAIALLFPVAPLYDLGGFVLPYSGGGLGVFSLTILSNTVVVGALYPVGVAVANLLRGHVAWPMLVGRPIRAAEADETYGLLLETPEGYTRQGLDLDALRMYLNWRGATLAELRDDPETYRDPASLPDEPNPPGDGEIVEQRAGSGDGVPIPDGGDGPAGGDDEPADGPAAGPDDGAGAPVDDDSATKESEFDDTWGAQRFLDDLDHGAYGTSAADLRDGIEVLVSSEVVWISPGIPFLVPTFFGTLVAFVYGDVLFSLMDAVGLV